jgi:uncharacterized protein
VLELTEKGNAVTMRVRVQPRASRTEIVGEYAGAIKIRIAAPPVGGKANDECRRFLAKLIGVNAGSVEIIAGESLRDKVVRIHTVTKEHVSNALSILKL